MRSCGFGGKMKCNKLGFTIYFVLGSDYSSIEYAFVLNNYTSVKHVRRETESEANVSRNMSHSLFTWPKGFGNDELKFLAPHDDLWIRWFWDGPQGVCVYVCV